jgi:hypothetical protein
MSRATRIVMEDPLGPSQYGSQLAAFLDYFDRRQVLVIASEVLRDNPRESAIPRELRDRLAECLADDLHRFEDLLGHQIPSHWGWSAPRSGTGVSAEPPRVASEV